jgi:hypothetical protein
MGLVSTGTGQSGPSPVSRLERRGRADRVRIHRTSRCTPLARRHLGTAGNVVVPEPVRGIARAWITCRRRCRQACRRITGPREASGRSRDVAIRIARTRAPVLARIMVRCNAELAKLLWRWGGGWQTVCDRRRAIQTWRTGQGGGPGPPTVGGVGRLE